MDSRKSSVFFRINSLVIMAALLLGACRGPAVKTATPTRDATPSQTETAIPAPVESGLAVIDDGSPLPPQVLERMPQGGQELPTGEVIEVTFDQPMDAKKSSAAWQVSGPQGEAVQGKVSWPSPNVLRFSPAQPLKVASLYQASLGEQAASAQGVPLSEPYNFQFATLGTLQVSQVFPVDGAQDVAGNVAITVVFNRPVVPLVIAEEQAGLPQPLVISPPVEGKGEWVNTSVYAFQPEKPLKGGRAYSVTVKAGLEDATGETHLAETYRWQFSTAAPAIESFELSNGVVNPQDNCPDVLLDETFTIRFLQPMDTASTEEGLSITSDNGENVPLATNWNEALTNMVITPTQRLALDTGYQLLLSSRARAADGGELKEGLDWSFTTIPPPAVVSTNPRSGSVQEFFTSELFLKFASPMRIDTVKSRVVISPEPEKDFEWWYNEWDWSMVAFVLKPSTRYIVRLLPGMEDIYGNKTTEEQTIRFTTAAYSPTASLLMPWDAPLMRADGPPESQSFYATYTNVDSVRFELHSLTKERFMSFLSGKTAAYEYNPPDSTIVWQKEETPDAVLNERVVKSFQLTTASGEKLPAGFYFLGMDAAQLNNARPFDDYRLLVVANANLTFKSTGTQGLIWLTDLENGQPMGNVPVTLYDAGNARVIGDGISDQDGIATIAMPPPLDPYTSRYAIAESAEAFGFASSQWGSGVSLYDYGIWSSYYAPANQPTAYVYTERPIYRPGQPVYFKGILRLDDDLDYSLPDLSQVKVKISSYEETVYETDLPLSEYGSFDGQFTLDQEAALGYYTLQAYLPGGEDSVGSVTFNVAEYRKPEFQVQVSAEPTDVLPGESFTVMVSADYYSGGGVKEAEVQWTLTSAPFMFTPPSEYSSYNFSDFEEDVYLAEGTEETESKVIAEGIGRTDSNGRFTITLQADLSGFKSSRELTFEATVMDTAKATASGRDGLVVHRSAVYPGVRPQAYVGEEGKEQFFEMITLDWEGAILPDQTVSVEIVERRWYSVQEQDASGRVTWTSTVEEIPVETFEEVKTNQKGEGLVGFTPPKGGIYRAKVTAVDTKGNPGKASAYLWVAGKEYIPWQQTNDRSFDLVSDKKEYTPGETASILIASPFEGEAYALVTVERGRIHSQEVALLKTNSTLYKLPVTSEMAPNIYVSVVVVKGVDESNPRPNFKMGVVELGVEANQQTLSVAVTPDESTTGPGEQLMYSVEVRDYRGNGVEAEVSLGLSDLATLSLLPPNSLPIDQFFYSERTLGVWTSMSMVQSLDDYNINIRDEVQEGPGMGSGGAKGEGDLGVIEVREDFPDTAYWDAKVVTDENGQATVMVRLPDNLTTWRMDARAVTQDTRVGQTAVDIVSTKPLLVRPQTPRFFIANDEVRLGTAVHNNTGKALTAKVSLEAQGLALKSQPTTEVKIPPLSVAYVTWEGVVNPEAERVDLVFSAEAGELKDASRPPQGTLDKQGIPVYRYAARETVGTSGMMTEGGNRVEAISLPSDLEAAQGNLTIQVSPSLAAGMTDGLTYLEHFPYECVEQTISRFLPNVISARALKTAGLSNPELEANLKNQVETALQRLYNWQNPDGGWGWWRYRKSDTLTSTYAVLGLIEAQEAGYLVSESVLERGMNYLRTQIVPIRGLTNPQVVNRQAFILYVLARGGMPDVSNSVQLYEQRQRMALYAQAFLSQTLYLIDAGDLRLQTMLSDFNSAAIVSASGTHWEEKELDRWNWNTNTRSTAIILHTLSLIDPQNPLNANAVRWLMSSRTGGHWLGTQETAWTLMALTNWMQASGEMQADYEYGVMLNGEQLGGGEATRETLQETLELEVDIADMLQDEANRLAFGRSNGPGNLYYTAYLNVFLPVEETQALDQGIVVSRSYYRLDDLYTPVTESSQGDLLLARVTVVAPYDLHYIVIDDPLPAGLEAVDQSLSTSPQSVEIPQAYSWDDIWLRGWGWWYFTHTQYRDEKVILSTDFLPAGTYVYTYLVRAGTVGVFRTIPTTAQEFYFPEVYGRGEGSLFTVNP